MRWFWYFDVSVWSVDKNRTDQGCVKIVFSLHTARTENPYVWVSDQSNIAMFWVKKLISQSTVPAESPFFEEMIFTHKTLMPIFFWTPLTPPICLKMTKCAIFSTFWESHFKNTPKVGVHRENFNIGNLSQIFFGDFYTC